MKICQNCNTQVLDYTMFCPTCGTSLAVAAPPPMPPPFEPQPVGPPVEQQPTHQNPVQQPPVQPQPQPPRIEPQPQRQTAPTVYQEEPISTAGYFGILFLLMIPVINLLFLIIWACGGCNKRNKRNLSRAMLLWMLISTIISVLLILTGSLLFAGQIEAVKEWIMQMGVDVNY